MKAFTPYVVVDGYFIKWDFIAPLVQKGLHILTKMRRDQICGASTADSRKKAGEGQTSMNAK
jgi:hypothetical protein